MRKNAFIGCGAVALGFVLALVLYRMTAQSWSLTVAITLGTVFYHYALRLAVGEISAWAHRFTLDPNNSWFRQKKWEPELYRLLRVRGWKDKLPTYAPDSFNPRKTAIATIIQNTCHAELVHEVIALLSFVPVVFCVWFGALGVFLITSLVAALSDLVFSVLQRYNRPRLLRLQAKIEN